MRRKLGNGKTRNKIRISRSKTTKKKKRKIINNKMEIMLITRTKKKRRRETIRTEVEISLKLKDKMGVLNNKNSKTEINKGKLLRNKLWLLRRQMRRLRTKSPSIKRRKSKAVTTTKILLLKVRRRLKSISKMHQITIVIRKKNLSQLVSMRMQERRMLS